MVEGYEKALQDCIDSNEAKIERRRQNTVKMLEKMQADRETISKAMMEQPVRELEAQWEKQQEARKANMAAALAACSY